MRNILITLGDWLIAAGVRLKWRGATGLTPPASPVVTRIPVKPGNLGTLHGWSTKVPVRVVKRTRIEVKYVANN